MLERIVGNGVRVILVETASRFARSVLTQEVGFGHLQGLGVTLIAVDSPESFLSQEPMMVALRQMQGVFSQLDKATLVAKLKSGRERKKRETGKGCGRKSLAELAPDGGGARPQAQALPGQRSQALAQRGRGGARGPGLRHPPRHPLRRRGGGAHGRGGLAMKHPIRCSPIQAHPDAPYACSPLRGDTRYDAERETVLEIGNSQ